MALCHAVASLKRKEVMPMYRLTIIRVPESSDGPLIGRTHTVKAGSLREAESRSVVERLVSCMDNVVEWSVELIQD